MKISYGVTVCDEVEEIKELLSVLFTNKREEDEIVVLVDSSNTTDELVDYLVELRESQKKIKLHLDRFNKNFSDWKNLLTSLCSGDYIFQIDADEIPTTSLIHNLPMLINQGADILLVPRINKVIGIEKEHISKWGWIIDAHNRVNWPDYQWRIYKNVPNIKWENKVHERLTGFTTYAVIPADEFFALNHIKSIEKQEKQNNFYNTL